MATSRWQIKLSSVKERNGYAFKNSMFCDVDLSVMDANGDKVVVPAHKYVLAISSPFFEDMFYGEQAQTGRTIDLPDCTNEGLQEVFRYVYSDKVKLTGSNVMEVLCLAEKYMMPFLKEKCEEYLEKELKVEDVFHVLPQVRNEKIELLCWDLVDHSTERAVCSKSFLNLSKEMLCKVLSRDTITVDEMVLFQAVEKWALNKVKEKGLEDNRKNRREVLGQDVIKLIRFPLMSQEEFAEKVLPCGILEIDEVTELIQMFSELSPVTRSFSDKRRGQPNLVIPDMRFDSVQGHYNFDNWVNSWGPEAIDFMVNKPLLLSGVRLFGNSTCTYEVSLTFFESDKKIKQFSSSLIQTESEPTDGYYGFNIILDKPVVLKQDVVYTIEGNISGPMTFCGKEGKRDVYFKDIVMKYMDSKKPTSNTSVAEGQFPTLIFKRP